MMQLDQDEDLQRTQSEYDALPEPIKTAYSFKEWLWLSGEQKQNLTYSECIPDHVE